MLRTVAGSNCEVSRTTSTYVPYPRLRFNTTSAHDQSSETFEMRRCKAPSLSVQAFSPLYGWLEPPRSLAIVRTSQSYPLNLTGFVGAKIVGPAPFTTAASTTPPPLGGKASMVGGGLYSGPT